MPTSLTVDQHVAALESVGTRLLDDARSAGLAAAVPSCPAWDVRALLAHQTMVHRWATAHIRVEDPDPLPNQTTIRETVDDIEGYYADGLQALVAALQDAPPDLAAMTFLKDAPPPRQFWARRQAHETAMHGVDALAARLGRLPTTDEAAISVVFAEDGLDELLRGFFARGKSKLFDGEEYSLLVAPTDSARRWLVHVAETLTVEPGDPDGNGADATFSGSTAALYLALWNRGDAITASGRDSVLDAWHTKLRIGWS